MTDDSIIGIISLAISVAQLVPIFSKGSGLKTRIIAVATLAAVLTFTLVSYREQREYSSAISELKSDIMSSLTEPKTFEELLTDLYYADYGEAEEAVDQLVAERKLKHDRMRAISTKGDTLEVRVYNRRAPDAS